MATVKLICSTSPKLDTIPFKAGQVIFVEDERSIYVDGTERIAYREIITLATELARTSLHHPVTSFYFINETKCLWQFDGVDWIQLTSPPEKQIVFDDKANFPAVGDFYTIYIDGVNMYRYINDKYQLMNSGSGGSVWVEI